MQHLEYEFDGRKSLSGKSEPFVITGVVTSANLEVMMEKKDLNGKCRFVIDTAAEGFEKIWEAVVSDFMERAGPSDVLVSINDNAASPSVVSLRLDQAFEQLKG